MSYSTVLFLALAVLLGSAFATEISPDLKKLLDSYISDHVNRIADTVKNETDAKWQQKFDLFQQEAESRLAHLEQKKSRSRRDLRDITSLSAINAVRSYVPSGSNVTNPNFFPTTRSQSFHFFALTPSNSKYVDSYIGQETALANACLAHAQYMRCKTSDCTQFTKNHVAQNIYSWEPFRQVWLEVGPGASGDQSSDKLLTSYRPVVANGVRGLTHFSPDGIHDFLVPASFDEDVGSSTAPTEQCTDIWLYVGQGLGWKKYQECAWKGHGTHSIKAFKIQGEQYLVQSNMVHRVYSSSNMNQLLIENYNQPSYVFKWSQRTQDNFNDYYPFGFFLSGGEATNGSFSSNNPRYSPDIGNNGANVFQVLESLNGVTDVEVFQIVDMTFLAFSEHVSNRRCGFDGLGDGSTIPACQTVEIESHIYVFDDSIENPRGDCPPASSNLNISRCQTYQGQFRLLQAIPTKGARSIHYFSVPVTGAVHYFLAIAEHRDDLGNSVNSSIWKWNGQAFTLFQRIETQFATKFSSFVINTEVFLVGANRGCAEIERESDANSIARCDGSAIVGRSRIWSYDTDRDLFALVPESEAMGTLHAYGATYDSESSDPTFSGVSAMPVSVEPFQLPSYLENTGFGSPTQYLAVSNFRVIKTDTIGNCPNSDNKQCFHPFNIFSINVDTSKGITSLLNAVSQAAADTSLYLTDLRSKIDGGQDLRSGIRYDPVNGNINTFAASASVSFKIDKVQYVAMAFEESYITYEDCLAMYTDEHGPATECHYLSSQGTASTAIATSQHCMQMCNSTTQSPTLRNRKTNTIIYKVGSAQTTIDQNGREINVKAPKLIEIQRIPSLGVSHLHFFQQIAPTTQESYEACLSNSSSSTCYNEATAAKQNILIISNSYSSCEYDLIRNRPNPRDPSRGGYVYIWNSSTLQFTHQSNNVIQGCRIGAVHDFSTPCQALSISEDRVPACGRYLAVEEDCRNDLKYYQQYNLTSDSITMKVSFHKWVGNAFHHCQPYPDPGDLRNHAESLCSQPSDAHRTPLMVSAGDRQFYDFPDLLPSSLVIGSNLTDDSSGYIPQLSGQNIAGLHFGIPRAQKDIFFVNSTFLTPISDSDQEPRTLYFVNGRKKFDAIFSVVYDSMSGPQVFALESLFPKDPVCALGHPTTPKRRMFSLLQTIPVTDTSGGRNVKSFERLNLGGILSSYFVFPEFQYRQGAVVNPSFASAVSSVYKNSVCNEYTATTFINAVTNHLDTWGTLGPANDQNLPTQDSKYCPYSLDPIHFEAWETFFNYYNPVSPCKGKHSNLDGATSSITQKYFNGVPPASILSKASTVVTPGPYMYARPSNNGQTIDTHGYSTTDYQVLHDTRDDVLSKLQDVLTFGASSVAITSLCGGGPLFMFFGHNGYDVLSPPTSKKMFYVWNDRYAVDGNGECTAAGARLAWQSANNNILNVELGCFEFATLTVPVNNGATSSISLFQTGDFFFVLTLNHGVGGKNVINPGACSKTGLVNNITTTSQIGVISTIWTLDLSLHGGIQCRQDICCSRDSKVNSTGSSLVLEGSFSDAALDQLRNTFVDLTSDQIVSGRKSFTSDNTSFTSVNISNHLLIGGDAYVIGDVIASNIETEGYVDGVDLSLFQEQQNQQFYSQGWGLANLETNECSKLGGCPCSLQPLKTACFPKASLNMDGFSVLKDRFHNFLTALLREMNITANISSVHAFPLQQNFLISIQSCDHIAYINATSFTDSCLCQDSPNPALPKTQSLAEITVILHNASCEAMDLAQLEVLRLAIASGLSNYGTRQADVFFTKFTCLSDVGQPRIKVSFKVSSSAMTQSTLSSKLMLMDTWKTIYDAFVSRASSCIPTNDFAFEYLPGEFVPDFGGSGQDIF